MTMLVLIKIIQYFDCNLTCRRNLYWNNFVLKFSSLTFPRLLIKVTHHSLQRLTLVHLIGVIDSSEFKRMIHAFLYEMTLKISRNVGGRVTGVSLRMNHYIFLYLRKSLKIKSCKPASLVSKDPTNSFLNYLMIKHSWNLQCLTSGLMLHCKHATNFFGVLLESLNKKYLAVESNSSCM